jgi:hypothetical protein
MSLPLADFGIIKISSLGQIDIDILGATAGIIAIYTVVLFITFFLYKVTGLRSLFILVACILGVCIAIFSFYIYMNIISLESALLTTNFPPNFKTVLQSNVNELKLAIYSILGTTFVFCVTCLYLHSYLGSKPSNIPQNTQVGGKRRH